MYNEPPSVAHNINLRFKGAYMGYNTLDPPMELWPDAKWGNLFLLFIHFKFLFNFKLILTRSSINTKIVSI